ncbi:MAG: sensor histidine kinase [Xanthobacteraceae bacterium]
MSLRFRLSILVGIAVLPPLLLTAYNTLGWQKFQERDARDEALAGARLLSAEFVQTADGSRQLMIAMSKHPSVPDQEQACTDYFKSVLADLPIYRDAAVVDPTGKFHCSTVPIPETLDVSDRLYFRGPLTTGQLTIGMLTEGRVTHNRSIHISMPYRPPGAASDWVIVLTINPERLAQELASRPWRSRHRILALDREGALVMTSPNDAVQDADVLAPQIFGAAQSAAAGTIEAPDARGRTQIIGFAQTPAPAQGLLVAVAIDRGEAISPATDTARRSIVIGLFVLLLAIIGAWFATDFLIRRPIRALVDTARRREGGDIAARFPPLRGASELGELSAALSRMSAKIDELLEQKSFLLRELQHRVMNSLHLLSSMLSLQTRHVTDPAVREQLGRARDRILSMASVYRYLYQADSTGYIEVKEFLHAICEEAQRAYGGANLPSIEFDADPLLVTGSQATSLAVLTHELITNALKYAYAEGESGPISITFRRSADGFDLRVADRGRGLPPDFSLEQPNSLGMKVIAGTARQLGGTVRANRLDPGTEFVIHLPPNLGVAPTSPGAAGQV